MNANYSYNLNKFLLMGFAGFFFLTYFPGLIFYFPFKNNFESYYTYSGLPFIPLVFTVMLVVIVSVKTYFLLKNIPHLKVRFLSQSLVSNVFLIISFSYLLLGIYFFLNYDISFRHRQRLSESGALIIILFFKSYR